MEDEVIEEVEHFTCLGSLVDKQGGTETDAKVRIGMARVASLQLNHISSPFRENYDQNFNYADEGCPSLRRKDTESDGGRGHQNEDTDRPCLLLL